MRSFCSLVVLGVLLSGSLNAQSVLVTNPAQALIYTNPSFAGSNGFIRHQLAGGYTSGIGGYYDFVSSNTFDMFISPIKAGVALSVNQQSNDRFHSESVALTYAQYISQPEDHLTIIPSLQVGYGRKSWTRSWQSLMTPEGSPPVYISPTALSEVGVGLLVNYKDLYLGASILLYPDLVDRNTNYPLAVTSLNASYNLRIGEKNLLNFYFKSAVSMQDVSISLGTNAVFAKHLIAGLGLTIYDVSYLNINLGYRHKFFSVIFSYMRSNAILSANNLWQTSLSFNLRNKEQRRNLTNIEAW